MANFKKNYIHVSRGRIINLSKAVSIQLETWDSPSYVIIVCEVDSFEAKRYPLYDSTTLAEAKAKFAEVVNKWKSSFPENYNFSIESGIQKQNINDNKIL